MSTRLSFHQAGEPIQSKESLVSWTGAVASEHEFELVEFDPPVCSANYLLLKNSKFAGEGQLDLNQKKDLILSLNFKKGNIKRLYCIILGFPSGQISRSINTI